MSAEVADDSPRPLTVTQWLIVLIAIIGFAFDIYALLVLPLIAPDALRELGPLRPGMPDYTTWLQRLFYVPAFVGGLFGLLGGYLTDTLGRRRVLTGSILLYALSAFAAGYATSLPMLLVLRCTTFIGVCVEFVAATAWLAELFPHPRQKEKVLGYTQAFGSIGGLLVAVAYGLINQYAGQLPPIVMPEFLTGLGIIGEAHRHEAWRYTLMSGLIPAIPLILIRPFLPESPVWRTRKEAGTLRRPSFFELFGPTYLRTTVVTTLMVACAYGAAFGAIQQMPQMVPGLANVKQQTEGKPRPEQGAIVRGVAAEYTKVQEVGGLVGRFVLAILAVQIVSRRAVLRCFQVPGLLVVPLVFYLFLNIENREFFDIPLHSIYLGDIPITTVSLGMFLAGFFTVAQFSFWGNYLPRVYPVYLRGTGESFAANVGGRMIGTTFAALTVGIAGYLTPADQPQLGPQNFAYAAAAVALGVYLLGLLLTFFLPEPPKGEMPE